MGDARIIKTMADAVKALSQAVDDKAIAIKRLLSMIFGSKTEKKDSVIKKSKGFRKKKKKKNLQRGMEGVHQMIIAVLTGFVFPTRVFNTKILVLYAPTGSYTGWKNLAASSALPAMSR